MRLPADPRVRGTLLLAAAIAGLIALMAIVSRLAPEPTGPPSSSYATAPEGLAAYASLLERAGHPVRRVRTPVAEEAPARDQTLVVLDPDVMEPEEARAIGDWVRRGGRLVAGGVGDQAWLDAVLGDAPVWRGGAPVRRRTLVPVAETTDVTEVRGAERGAWHVLGPTLPAIGPAGAPLLVTASVGEGSVALLADPSPLQNRGLDAADNAALGLALAGEPRTTVAFLETVHGYGVARGFAGLPERVRWTLIGLALTALVAIWALGRRFGPAEDPDSDPPPPRVAYVDALAAALARAKPDKEKERS